MKKNTNPEKFTRIVNLPSKDLHIDPLTIEELEDAIKNRLSVITDEFERGFNFIKQYPKSVTFFGSARCETTNIYYEKAARVASLLAKEKYAVITGGGPGIMEAANYGARRAGGKSLGMTIKLPNEQVTNPYVNQYVEFYYFFSRKVLLSFSAEAYVYFPGGFGTLDEFFEIATLIQTGKIERVPIILFGSEYWNALDEFIKKQLLGRGAIDAEDRDLYTICDSEEEAVEIIKQAPVRYTG